MVNFKAGAILKPYFPVLNGYMSEETKKLLVFIAIPIVLAILVGLMVVIIKNFNHPKVLQIAEQIKTKFVWNGFLRSFIVGYLKYATKLMFLLNSPFSFKGFIEVIYLSAIVFGLMISTPCLISIHKRRLRTEAFK